MRQNLRSNLIGLGVLVCLWASAGSLVADLITNPAQLDAILGDQVQLEDFEGFSIAGGTYQSVPNPLNSNTAPGYMGILPGVTYHSPEWLRLYASSLLGDSSNVLAGGAQIDIVFDRPQLAVGMYIKNITGNLDYNDTITFYRGSLALGSVADTVSSGGETFYGWQDPLGIDRVVVQSDVWAIVDNVEFGVVVPEPAAGWCGVVVAGLICARRRRPGHR